MKKRKDEAVRRLVPFDSFRTKEEVKWKTLVHLITMARRVKGGLLVSHASRFSIGCRLPA